MSRDWEATFSSWGAPPGATEQTKCENAERAVRNAIAASEKLNSRSIEVFTQGSYANRTNVRQDSDVDICILYTGAFFPDFSLSPTLTLENLEYGKGTYPYSVFKNDVEAALVSFFGNDSVSRGNKAFDVHANSYRLDADIVPCFQHRRFMGTLENNWHIFGTELRPDDGGRIINWPQQNYDNGVSKNTDTGRRFKTVTRILKRLRFELIDGGHTVAESIPSYLIECLVWSLPNEGFQHSTLRADIQYTLAHLWNETRADETCKEWTEVNDLKYLLRDGQPWTRAEVNHFLQDAWDYIGFD